MNVAYAVHNAEIDSLSTGTHRGTNSATEYLETVTV